MRVTVVGSGDAFGSGGRFQTCQLVGSGLLVDCGATSMTALRQQGVDPNEIHTVALTHLHGDHFGGVPFLVLDGQFRRRTHDLTPFEVRHASGAPAYAVRVDGDGGSMAYSGDTEWTDALVDASADVDLFLCEGYSPTPVRWHLDLRTLASHRDRLTCRGLVLTHLSPTALAADLSDWEVAHDGFTALVG